MFSIKIRNIKSRYSVFEMAFDKAKFQDKVTDRIQQIAQNWCLCMYCHLYAPDTRTYHHWKMELFTLLDYLCNLSIKDKKSKTKYSYVAFTRQADYDDESVVFNACRNKFIIEKDKASIGMLQRMFKIGFNRAARIMDQLCEAGVVGEEEGTKPRKVLMSMEQFENFIDENI